MSDWKEAGPITTDFKRKCAQRRMSRALRLKPELQKICDDLGIDAEVKNNGVHWQFRKGGVVLNFFPTTNNITFQGPTGASGVRFTFNVRAFRHRKPIIAVALKELGGVKFVMGKNDGPPIELRKGV